MSQRFDIPQMRKIYTNIPDAPNQSSWMNQEYDYNGKTYIFCKFAAGQYIRQGDTLTVDDSGNAVIARNAASLVNAVAEWDIDASLAIQYSLVVKRGSNVKVSIAPDAVTSVVAQGFVVNYMNASARVANVNFNLPSFYASTNTATSAITLTKGTEANALIWANVGDVVNTNVGVSGVITSIPNGSSIVLGTAALGISNGTSVLCTVTSPMGTAQKGSMSLTCSAPVWVLTVGGSTGYPTGVPAPANVNSALGFNQVNVSTAATVFFANSCVSGQLVRVGDILTLAGDTGYSNRTVTSINNAYAFTVNAAATAETTYALGTGLNVNSKFAIVTVKTF